MREIHLHIHDLARIDSPYLPPYYLNHLLTIVQTSTSLIIFKPFLVFFLSLV